MTALQQSAPASSRGGSLRPGMSRRILVACWLAIFVRALVIVGLLLIPLTLVRPDVWEMLHVGVLGLIVVVLTGHIGLIVRLRCPTCRRRFLIERTGAKHPTARKRPHLDYWGTTVLDIMRARQFTCMYCGALHQLAWKDAKRSVSTARAGHS